MWLKRITLKQIGRHALLDVQLQRGLVGVFGPNGSGKSTMLDTAYSLLTNDWGRFPGVKLDNIRDTAGDTEESSGALLCEHHDVEFELYRALRARPAARVANNELRVAGKVFTKDDDIKREMRSRLGDVRLLDAYVFVAQWSMFSFLSQTPGERAAAYQTLCGTAKAKAIFDAIDELLESDKELLTEVVDNTDEINSRIALGEQQVAVVAGELEGLKKGLLLEAAVLQAEDTIRKRQIYSSLKLQLDAANSAVIALQAGVASAEKTKLAADQWLVETSAHVQSLRRGAEIARTTLSRIEQYEANQAKQKQAEDRLKTAQAALDAFPPVPELEADDAGYDTANHELSVTKNDYSRAKATLDQFAATGIVECPTCRTPMTQLDEHLKKMREELPVLLEKGRTLKATVDRIAAKRKVVIQAGERRAELQRNVRTCQALAALMVVGDPPQGNRDDLRGQIQAFEAADAKYLDATRGASLAEVNLARGKTALESREQQRAELLSQLERNTVTDERLARVTQALAEHNDARIKVASATQQIAGLRTAVARERSELTAVQTRIARSQKAREFAARLESLRSVMHRQALPQVVAQGNLEDMEEAINQWLESFGSPFWVQADQDLSFQVNFPGEPPKVDKRLSGGQKGVLALAFRAALADQFDTGIDLLVLDEPTAGMDEETRGCMAEALSRYAAQVRGKRQVIVITHADELRPAFDQVIDLGRSI